MIELDVSSTIVDYVSPSFGPFGQWWHCPGPSLKLRSLTDSDSGWYTAIMCFGTVVSNLKRHLVPDSALISVFYAVFDSNECPREGESTAPFIKNLKYRNP